MVSEESSWPLRRIHSPIPSHKLAEALKVSKPAWWDGTPCAAASSDFSAAFALAIFTALRWDLIVSGKPVVALIPFVIVGFEFTVLFAIFGNLIGFPAPVQAAATANLEHYDPRCSGEHFGVLASCAEDQREDLSELFRQNGGDVRVFG
jgi:hypothetical protein